MTFEDLAEFFDPSLRLPIMGKTYVVPPLTAAAGLRFEALRHLALASAGGSPLSERHLRALQLSDDEELDLYRDALGSAYTVMVDDGVPWPHLQHAGQTAFIHWTRGEAAAELHWRSPGKAPGRDPRPAPTSSSTGAGSTTPSPASGSGTRSPTSSSPAPPPPG